MMRKILTALALSLGITAFAQNKTATITIDSRIKFQHVSGFGGFTPSPQWQYWLGDTEIDKLYGKGNTQLGLNIARIYISTNKSFWGSGVANAKRVKKYGGFIFASPWTPPASWKTNNDTSNGGSLKEEYYEAWADRLNEYYDYMKSQGVTIDAISIQNEPDWNATYESCIWTGEQLAKFLRLYGSKIKCKIVAPEAIHFTKSMHEPILNNPEACAQLDILGGHFYGWNGSSYPLAAQKGKEVWMTEYLINERQQNNKQNINWKDDGFLFARSINDAMLANMSAWVHYSLKRYYGALGDGDYGTSTNTITKRGWILSHYAKYVSGTTRVRHALDDASGMLTSSAYATQTGDSIVLMILNPSANTYSTTVNLPCYTKGGAIVVTDETTKNAKNVTMALDEETCEPVVEVAPWTVNTYIFKKSKAREDMPDVADEASLFADNYDLYGGGCVPTGWRSKWESGTRYAGNYDSGPRIMTFSPEGVLPFAFYFRSGTNGNGNVTYGEDTNNRLALEPGNYTLSYSVVGYKSTPGVTFYLKKTSGTSVKTLSSKPTVYVSANGSSSRITKTTDKVLDFEIKTSGNYVLNWTVAQATGGLNEVLLGNVRLIKHDEQDGIVDIPLFPGNEVIGVGDGQYYDLSGRKVANPVSHGIYVKNGKKVLK